MKLLWIVNIIFPEARVLALRDEDNKMTSGCWLESYAGCFQDDDEIKLGIATISNEVKDFVEVAGKRNYYYIIPYRGKSSSAKKSYIDGWERIIRDFSPDLVHIFGTEFFYGLSFVERYPSIRSVVSIQGIISSCSQYYDYGLDRIDIYRNMTFRDIIRGGIISEKKSFKKRGEIEKKILQRVNCVIGRTTWDKSITLSINPHLKYYKCNEPLRDLFYRSDKWHYEKCNKHSIFISQASYPLKGLHQVIRALPLILREFPDTMIRIGGVNPIRSIWWKKNGYGKILERMIEQYGIENSIEFLGPLSQNEMCRELLSANVFVSSSSIENSPNSVGEAQILGVPCVASYVGGVPDFFPGILSKNLYRYEEFVELAERISVVFKNSENYDNSLEIRVAEERHMRAVIKMDLKSIYNSIIKEESNETNHQ